MSESPDLSTLPARLRYAKSVLAEADERRGDGPWWWDSRAIDECAAKWEAEDRAAIEREQQVEELAQLIAKTGGWTDWAWLGEENKQLMRRRARAIIAAGWSKS